MTITLLSQYEGTELTTARLLELPFLNLNVRRIAGQELVPTGRDIKDDTLRLWTREIPVISMAPTMQCSGPLEDIQKVFENEPQTGKHFLRR